MMTTTNRTTTKATNGTTQRKAVANADDFTPEEVAELNLRTAREYAIRNATEAWLTQVRAALAEMIAGAERITARTAEVPGYTLEQKQIRELSEALEAALRAANGQWLRPHSTGLDHPFLLLDALIG